MHAISLLAVGSIKSLWIKEGCADYTKRLKPLLSFDIRELPASKERDAVRQADDECGRLLSAVDSCTGQIWVLDECGTDYTSVQFAEAMSKCVDRGESITFVLGGAYGLTDAVRERATNVVRLSAMTLPHELCRLVFLEQLYRSAQIQRGSGYHH